MAEIFGSPDGWLARRLESAVGGMSGVGRPATNPSTLAPATSSPTQPSSAPMQGKGREWARSLERSRYIPGTHLPSAGWYQPCVKCRDLTARCDEEEVYVCGRCANPGGKRPRSPAADSDASTDEEFAEGSEEAEEASTPTLKLPAARAPRPTSDGAPEEEVKKVDMSAPRAPSAGDDSDDDDIVSVCLDSPLPAASFTEKGQPSAGSSGTLAAMTEGASAALDAVLTDFLGNSSNTLTWSCWPCMPPTSCQPETKPAATSRFAVR
eukprot:jgi/Tetstr1/432500/TSEL_021874.t1